MSDQVANGKVSEAEVLPESPKTMETLSERYGRELENHAGWFQNIARKAYEGGAYDSAIKAIIERQDVLKDICKVANRG